MALTITRKQRFIDGDRVCIINDVTFDSSYPTGGESLTRADLGFANQLHMVQCGPAIKATNDALCPTGYDYTNSKILCFGAAGGANGLTEIGDTQTLATFVARIVAWGI